MPRAFMLQALSTVVGLGILVAGCASVSIATDYDRTADFSHYKTFSFVGGHVLVNGVLDDENTLIKDRVRKAVVAALTAKGITEVAGDPDLHVAYLAGARSRTEVEGVGPYAPGFGPYWGWTGWWGPMYTQWWTRSYEEGTLIIDLIDAHSKKLIWRAYASSEVKTPVTEEKIRKAVEKAFSKYPPHG